MNRTFIEKPVQEENKQNINIRPQRERERSLNGCNLMFI